MLGNTFFWKGLTLWSIAFLFNTLQIVNLGGEKMHQDLIFHGQLCDSNCTVYI